MSKIMQCFIFTALLLTSIGCEHLERTNAANYRCNEQQLNMVEREYATCKKSEVFGCFEKAKRSQCDYIGLGSKEK